MSDIKMDIAEKEQRVRALRDSIISLETETRLILSGCESGVVKLQANAEKIRREYFNNLALLKSRLESVLSRPRFIPREKFEADVARLKTLPPY